MSHEASSGFAGADFILDALAGGGVAQHLEDLVIGNRCSVYTALDTGNGLLSAGVGVLYNDVNFIAAWFEDVVKAGRKCGRLHKDYEQRRADHLSKSAHVFQPFICFNHRALDAKKCGALSVRQAPRQLDKLAFRWRFWKVTDVEGARVFEVEHARRIVATYQAMRRGVARKADIDGA